MATTNGVHCCESDFGLDPELVLQSCGFARYLGESEELACVHRFADADGLEHELRVTPMLDTSLDELAAVHRSGGAEAPETALESGRVLASTSERHWVAVGEGPVLRRLSWSSASCPVEHMQPVLEAMAEAPVSPATAALPRLEFDPSPVEATGASLLATAASERDEPPADPPALPLGASALAVALLRSAATEGLEQFSATFDERARWGLPDRRQLGARSVARDPAAAMHALRVAAARLPADTRFHCPKPDRRSVAALARGEATMWCLWTDPTQLDLIAVALRGDRVVYLGLFPDAPLAPVSVPGEPPPPPAVSVPPIVCGDPHSIDYPGLCPVEHFVEDDDPDTHDDAESLEAELERAETEDESHEPAPPSHHRGERVRVVPPQQ